MIDEQARRFWRNTVVDPFEPLHINEKASSEERTAHATEYAAHYLYEINDKLGTLLRLLGERTGES